ncbi:hypothetical protein V8C34DRAFT_278288 [Trichoderma compactum]
MHLLLKCIFTIAIGGGENWILACIILMLVIQSPAQPMASKTSNRSGRIIPGTLNDKVQGPDTAGAILVELNGVQPSTAASTAVSEPGQVPSALPRSPSWTSQWSLITATPPVGH